MDADIKFTSVLVTINGDAVASDQALKEHFGSCGEIESIEVKSNTEAVVKFVDLESAKKAVNMSGSKLEDSEVKVHLIGPKKKGRVLVSNLSNNITDEEVHTAFDTFGVIEGIRFFVDSAGIQCAYIHYESSESVDKALSMNFEMLNNKRLRVDYPNDPFRYHVEKTVIVHNMHERTTEEEIFNVFSQIGELENVEKVSKTRAYVAFKLPNDVKQALRIDKTVRGFKWHIMQYYQEANPTRKRRNLEDDDEASEKIKRTDNELYVANIPEDTTEKALREKYEVYGNIEAIHITQHPTSLVDCCYIEYTDKEDARKACVTNQEVWMGKRLRVCIVTEEIDVFGEGSAFSLMVKNFVSGTTEEELHDHFILAGHVAYVKKVGNGCAVVAYHREADAKRAQFLIVLHPLFSSKESYLSIKYKGKQTYDVEQILHVKFSEVKRADKGFYYSILRKEMETFFQPCGRVINYFTESRNGAEANNSLVIMENRADASKANGNLHSALFKGYKMSVRLIKSKERPDLPFNLRTILKKPFIIDSRLEFIQSDKAIFVSNIPQTETPDTFKAYFKDCGDITDMKVVGTRDNAWSCYAIFGSREEATKAKEEKNCKYWNDKLIIVRYSNEKDLNENNVGRVIAVRGFRRHKSSRKIFLSPATSEELYEHFIKIGEIDFIRTQHQNSLVCFKKKEDAEAAVSHVHFKDNTLNINIVPLKNDGGDDEENKKTE